MQISLYTRTDIVIKEINSNQRSRKKILGKRGKKIEDTLNNIYKIKYKEER